MPQRHHVRIWKPKGTLTVLLLASAAAVLASACAAKGVSTAEPMGIGIDASPSPDLARSDAAADAADATSSPPLPVADAAPPPKEAATVDPIDASDAAKTCNAVLFFAPIGLPDCDQCLTNECCGVTQACLEVPDCNALSTCLFTCDGADAGGCANACAAMHPASVSHVNAWTSCMTSKCNGYCT